jgi:RLL motif containing protein 1
VSERAPLEGAPRPEWHAAFGAYLAGLGCPLLSASAPYDDARAGVYVHWLIAHAVGLSFEDGAAGFNAAAEASVLGGSGASASGIGSSSEGGGNGGTAATAVPVPPAAASIIDELARLCGVAPGERAPFPLLQAVARAVRQRLLPASLAAASAAADAAEAGSAAAAASGGETGAARAAAAMTLAAGNPLSSLAAFAGKPALAPGARRGRRALAAAGEAGGVSAAGVSMLVDAETFPLGFATGDARVDAAAALLRMLYVADLRELQDAVNDILISVQEFTADPKTDASLGQVGR